MHWGEGEEWSLGICIGQAGSRGKGELSRGMTDWDWFDGQARIDSPHIDGR